MDNNSTIPKRAYSGKVNINGSELGCAVLDDRTRVLTSTAVFEAFGRPRKGKSLDDKRLSNMPSFLDAKNLEPYINNVFPDGFNMEVKYTSKNGKVEYTGYNAEILPLICEVYLQANDDDVLLENQKPLAEMSGILVRALSKVGITALIDEATGYEKDREEEELQKILAAYISVELLPWTKVFPDEFYKELYRLKNWEYNGHYRNSYVGKLTNFLIYNRLPEGVLEELKKLNPIIKGKKYRKHALHQRLSREHGYIQLRDLIYSDIALFRGYDTWEEFEPIFRRSFAVSESEKI